MLGYNTYFDLSPLTGQPLLEEDQPELYAKLLEIQKKIEIELEDSLALHSRRVN